MDPKPVRNRYFYPESIIFLVEDNLFKVPRLPFESNGIFATVFTLPAGENTIEGCSDEHPFTLEGVNKVDFERFLRALYPRGDMASANITTCMNVEDWTSVLKLSTMWEFSETRKLAIEKLSEVGMDLVTKVILAKQYEVREWLFAAYEGLVKRKESLSVAEAERLGLATAIRLYRIREECSRKFKPPGPWSHPNAGTGTSVFGIQRVDFRVEETGPAQYDCEAEIRRDFAEELRDALEGIS